MSELFKRAKTWIEICWFYTCATLLIVYILSRTEYYINLEIIYSALKNIKTRFYVTHALNLCYLKTFR